MKLFVCSSLSPAREGVRRELRGFTLLELFLAVLAIGLVAYIAVTEIRKFSHRARRDVFVADVRRLAAVFEKHHSQKGEWPAATNLEIRIPRGMEASLAETAWAKGPPFGGSYDWIPPLRSNPADAEADAKPVPAGMIAVTAFSPSTPLALSAADLLYLDQKLDDGNLTTGRFRTGFNGWPVYLVFAAAR
jgi:type II secretory pathway pseudopilin PulG